MKIMVDLDRVVFDCPSFTYFLGNLLFTRSNQRRPLKYKVVDAEKAKNAINSLFFLKPTHIKNLVEVNNAVEILKLWNKQKIEIHFVSSRPNLKSFQKVAVEWLAKNKIAYDKLIFACNNKPKYCEENDIDIMIDDTIENCINSAYLGIIALWFRTKNNKNINYYPEFIFPVSHWKEINKYVQIFFGNTKGNINYTNLEK